MDGVKLVDVNSFVDDRGVLTAVLQDSDSLFPPIRRLYTVGNFGKGIIRGFHKHFKEWKCFFVPHGSAKFVLVDDRKGSDMYGKIESHILTSRKPAILVIPPGIYNGWVSLEEGTVLLGISSENFDKNTPDDTRIDPFTYGKEVWEVKAR